MLWKSLASTVILLSAFYSTTLADGSCTCPPSTSTGSGSLPATSSTSAPTGGASPSADSSYVPAGSSSAPAGSSSAPAGSSSAPAGSSSAPAGSSYVPAGSSYAPAGSSYVPAGSSYAPAGSSYVPAGSSYAPAGSSSAPAGSSSTSTGTSSTPAGTSSSPASSSTSSGASSGPQFVIYSDKWVTNSLPDVADVQGYTVFALSFLLSTGPADQAQGWAQLDSNTRQQLKSKYNAAGIKVVVSAFGGTETPTTSGVDATQAGTKMAQWVIDNDLDGIDVDYEDSAAMNVGDGKAEEWLSTFTQTLRSKLPKGQYIVTHAPLAPWFSTNGYKSGAYRTVNKNVGDMIDWYNIQFYNQNDYTDCNGLITKSSNTWPGTSLSEIAASGVDQSKLIVGKPATQADASNGYIDPDTLATCLQQAKASGWSGGAMVWQYPNANAQWIKTVRAKSWPVSS